MQAANCDDANSDNLTPAETAAPNKRRGRGPSLKLCDDVRGEISRRINEEKEPVKAVARELGLPSKSVGRIAGIARGDERHVPKPRQPGPLKRGPRKPPTSPLPPKMDVPMPPCPFSTTEPHSLRGKELSESEKYYLACLVNVQRQSSSLVSAKYDLVLRTVRRYAASALAGEDFKRPGGVRSSIVDAESDHVLRAMASLEGAARPSREDFLSQLKIEAAKTQERTRKKKQKKKKKSPSADVGAEAETQESDAETEETTVVGSCSSHVAAESGARFRSQTYRKYLKLYGF